jgi:hypothetical protein
VTDLDNLLNLLKLRLNLPELCTIAAVHST